MDAPGILAQQSTVAEPIVLPFGGINTNDEGFLRLRDQCHRVWDDRVHFDIVGVTFSETLAELYPKLVLE